MDSLLQSIILTVIIGIGLIGNIISICIFSRKSFSKFSVRNMFIVKLVDNMIIIAFLLPGIWRTSGYTFLRTTWYCKILLVIQDSLPAYNAWILVFISLERMISTKFHTGRLRSFFNNNIFQYISLLIIFLICLFFYSPSWMTTEIRFYKFVNYSLKISSEPTNIAGCFIPANFALITYFVDMTFGVLVPFVLLITSSITIILTIRQLRSRIMNSTSSTNSSLNTTRAKKDIDYARTILLLDFIFLFFHFPNSFYGIIGNYIIDYTITNIVLYFLNYVGFSINFFVYLIFNKNFRKEFLDFLNFIYKNIYESTSSKQKA